MRAIDNLAVCCVHVLILHDNSDFSKFYAMVVFMTPVKRTTTIDFHRLLVRRAQELMMPRDSVRDIRENASRFTNDELRELIDQESQPAGLRLRFFNKASEQAHYESLVGSYDQARLVAFSISLRFLRS